MRELEGKGFIGLNSEELQKKVKPGNYALLGEMKGKMNFCVCRRCFG